MPLVAKAVEIHGLALLQAQQILAQAATAQVAPMQGLLVDQE
jgi:hypothetical protein